MVLFRADAAFAKPEIYEALKERKVKYTIRLPANDNLERKVAQSLTRSAGRPSYKPWFGTGASSIKRPVGRERGGWWQRWSSTSGSCSRGWGLS